MKKKIPYKVLIPFILLFAFFLITTYSVLRGYTLSVDRLIVENIAAFHTDLLTKMMRFFSFIGATRPVIVISLLFLGVIYLKYRRLQDVILFALVSLGSVTLNVVLKMTIKRERPESSLIVESGYSYPSAHTMAAVSLYGMIIYLLWKHTSTVTARIILITFGVSMILMIAFSRIYLGVHYASDIIGGVLLSSLWLLISLSIFQRYRKKEKKKSTQKDTC
ncbi:phosphoesterase PA-phosphatase related protein [Alkalihalophilus pseudofirmus OF4]|uniref:Phosphoesterase PA-phosphatase related protein n=1 Tax=Alkalihalophilus pseudofirmus (strain ATCC BAA-2126 / JCM 17055 / OF4) TaxID=398511 RepID=D3FXF8_ALKPO|nr:phosphatase PAP2 family protein [Alkalihalophilus pseudofirmus]ADC50669.1 phosphoesterase PA-phosphatase related protein [Alkalihalophilus pseudofirmus OF4]